MSLMSGGVYGEVSYSGRELCWSFSGTNSIHVPFSILGGSLLFSILFPLELGLTFLDSLITFRFSLEFMGGDMPSELESQWRRCIDSAWRCRSLLHILYKPFTRHNITTCLETGRRLEEQIIIVILWEISSSLGRRGGCICT